MVVFIDDTVIFLGVTVNFFAITVKNGANREVAEGICGYRFSIVKMSFTFT